MKISLPTPPSLNSIFRNVPGRGRVKVTSYKNWEMAALLSVKAQRPTPIMGKVTVDITVKRSRGDIDNRIKACLDILTKAGCIDDDRYVEEVTARWGDVDGAVVKVEAA
jgi:crossover junction endodeoxyribonuclease RusA